MTQSTQGMHLHPLTCTILHLLCQCIFTLNPLCFLFSTYLESPHVELDTSLFLFVFCAQIYVMAYWYIITDAFKLLLWLYLPSYYYVFNFIYNSYFIIFFLVCNYSYSLKFVWLLKNRTWNVDLAASHSQNAW